jgi:hypothetical protein
MVHTFLVYAFMVHKHLEYDRLGDNDLGIHDEKIRGRAAYACCAFRALSAEIS